LPLAFSPATPFAWFIADAVTSVVDAGIAVPLIEVALAAPSVGVTSVGDVASTTLPEPVVVVAVNWLVEFVPTTAAEAGTEAPFTFPTVMARLPAAFVTSPVCAGFWTAASTVEVVISVDAAGTGVPFTEVVPGNRAGTFCRYAVQPCALPLAFMPVAPWPAGHVVGAEAKAVAVAALPVVD
jgi:hypothetical protein